MISGSLDNIYQDLDAMADVTTYLPPAAQEVRAHLQATSKAHTTPEGKPWKPTLKGEPALNGAPNEISVRVAGQTIITELEGNSVWWHFGVRGAEPRPVIPVDIIGEKLGNALARGAANGYSKRSRRP
jgi:hypothetical protein